MWPEIQKYFVPLASQYMTHKMGDKLFIGTNETVYTFLFTITFKITNRHIVIIKLSSWMII
jgi:hypothetical protein